MTDISLMKRARDALLVAVGGIFLVLHSHADERSFIVRCVEGKCLNAYYQEEHPSENLTFVRTAERNELAMLDTNFRFVQKSGLTTGIFKFNITEKCQKVVDDSLKSDPSGGLLSWEWIPPPREPKPPSIPLTDKQKKSCEQDRSKNSTEPVTEIINNELKIHCAFDVERISDTDSYMEYFGTYFATITPRLKKWLL